MKNEELTAEELKEIEGQYLLHLYEKESELNPEMTGYRKILWNEIGNRLKK